jgi:phospholipid/cholesterol/gamma-HCH transport system substrate-binding protein
MPRTRSLAWSEVKIGVMGVAALVLAAMLIVAVGGAGGFFQDAYRLRARFDNVHGLERGAMVRLNGREVGSVSRIQFAGDGIDVVIRVDKDVQPLVTEASTARIGTMGMLGDAVIDLTMAKGRPLEEWAYVKSGTNDTDPAQLVGDIRSGKGTLGQLATDKRLYENMNSAATELRNLIAEIRKDPKKFLKISVF